MPIFRNERRQGVTHHIKLLLTVRSRDHQSTRAPKVGWISFPTSPNPLSDVPAVPQTHLLAPTSGPKAFTIPSTGKALLPDLPKTGSFFLSRLPCHLP